MTCAAVQTWMLDIHGVTVEDLDTAATAAADVDNPAIMDGAWR
jgi:hypothetical protein